MSTSQAARNPESVNPAPAPLQVVNRTVQELPTRDPLSIRLWFWWVSRAPLERLALAIGVLWAVFVWLVFPA